MIASDQVQRSAAKRRYACVEASAENSAGEGDGELCAEWSRTVAVSSASVDDDDDAEIHRSRAVQRDFIDLSNAQNLFDLSQANGRFALRKTIEYQCMSIISTISCIVSALSSDDAQKTCFAVFIEGTKAFLRSTPQEKQATLDSIAQKCIEFAPTLTNTIRGIDRQLKTQTSQRRLSAAYLLQRQTLFEYKILVSDIEFLGTLVVRQDALKKTGDHMRAMMSDDKFRLFRKAMRTGPVVSAPVTAADPHCHICRSDYCDARDVKRMTLACCKHRQSICETCFVTTSYQKSNEGIKTFSLCPFCRTEYALYDDTPAISPSPGSQSQ